MKIVDIVQNLTRVEPVPQRPLALIDGIAIHHSSDEGTPEGWARYHTTPKEHGGPWWNETPATTARSIGYHVAIMRDGQVFKCAKDTDRVPGVAGHNYHLIHVVCQGHLGDRPPTEAQFASLLWVVRQVQHAYYTRITNARVRTHGEWVTEPMWATSCPGIQYLGALVRGALIAGAGNVARATSREGV